MEIHGVYNASYACLAEIWDLNREKMNQPPTIDLSESVLEDLPTQFIHAPWMQHYPVLPLKMHHKKLNVAIAEVATSELYQALQFHTGCDISWVHVRPEQLNALRKKIFSQDTLQQASATFSVKNFVDNLLQEAIEKKVSDMHFEPYEKSYRVRFRLDGLLVEMASAPLALHERVSAYLKVMAHLDTAERRLPQDGRFQSMGSDGNGIDCRMSSCPTVNGEKIVIRLLHRSSMQRDIDSLGFNAEQKQLFFNALKQPQGMIFVTGPTGSGKTVTLYTALQYLNHPKRNISTIEEPVEIKLPGINQVGVNLKAGLTFSKAVRAFLRQDPDVIMVGEIRDVETAQIAVSAAQTGHLVLSTLHANGAVETITRMTHMGVPSFQIADSVRLIIAQRLARKLCVHCQSPGRGCPQCHQGYKGRIGLFELLPVTTEFCDQIVSGVDPVALYQSARQTGMMSLRESGLEKVALNLTTLEEIERVIGIN